MVGRERLRIFRFDDCAAVVQRRAEPDGLQPSNHHDDICTDATRSSPTSTDESSPVDGQHGGHMDSQVLSSTLGHLMIQQHHHAAPTKKKMTYTW